MEIVSELNGKSHAIEDFLGKDLKHIFHFRGLDSARFLLEFPSLVTVSYSVHKNVLAGGKQASRYSY